MRFLPKRSDDQSVGWRPVLRLVRARRAQVAVLCLVSFTGAMFEAGMLVLMTGAIVSITARESSLEFFSLTADVETALILAGILLVMRVGLAVGAVFLSAGMVTGVLGDLRNRVSTAFLGAQWETQQAEPSGRLQELMTTFVNRATGSVSAFAGWLSAWLSLAAFLLAAVIVDPRATIFMILALAALGGVLYPLRAAIRRRATIEGQTGLEFTAAVSEFGGLGLEMQVYGAQEGFLRRIRDVSEKNIKARYRVWVLSGSLAPIYTALAYSGAVLGAVLLSRSEAANATSIAAVLLLMLRSLSYGQSLQVGAGSIAEAVPYVARLEDAISSYQNDAASDGELVAASVVPLTLVEVGFSYSADNDALSDVSMEIQPGEIIGVIGPSGAGKSTLAQLLLGLRPPSRGIIAVSGTDLESVDRRWWAERVSMVAQDANLLTGTVSDNVCFFREKIGSDAVRDALREANLLAEINALPRGTETHLGERGTRLSGGQRQRLSIARALAGNPELLILDEPTSALDVRSESLIRESLERIRGKTTVVIIAHRMSTLDSCDRILVIEGGRVTGFDTPKNLRKENAFYRNALAVSGNQTDANNTSTS